MPRPTPVILCILDGWGERAESEDNAIAQAHTPHWDRLRAAGAFGALEASERHVGLPSGQMGNSEVGHMNIGAGRVVMQDLPRIDAAIADGSLAQNAALRHYIAALQKSGGTAHLLGLLSDGGVHAHQSHLMALAEIISAAGIPVAIHAFLDGRDVAPKSAEGFVEKLEEWIAGLPSPQPSPAGGRGSVGLATLSGRYFAMDRDKRWDRVQRAYDLLVEGKGDWSVTADQAIYHAYERDITDEFMPPTLLGGYDDYPGMQDGDGVLMVNFRADRARQLLAALTTADFDGFARERVPQFAALLGMAEYGAALSHIPAIFPAQTLTESLGEVVSAAGLRQLRIAETEKYAHVTFFFNGGREEVFDGESRIMVPSPKVATYDLQPEMAAAEVTDHIVAAIEAGTQDLIVVNYANTDMVGHSGDLAAAIKAVEAVDTCLGRLDAALSKSGGAMLITADHGNAECLHDPDSGQPHTAHTLNPVPCVVVGATIAAGTSLPSGILADIAPTVLALLALPQPAAMTGRNLLGAPL